MKSALAAFGAGVVFALGLALGGMTQPSKVVGFLDFFGDWDASLMFVMGGAIGVHAVAHRLTMRRASPLLDAAFHVPRRKDFTPQLVIGSALFGAGWGLGGFCPGPGITALPTLGAEALAFVGAMVAGMLGYEAWTRARAGREAVTTPTPGPDRAP